MLFESQINHQKLGIAKTNSYRYPTGEGRNSKSKIYAVCTDYFPFLHDLIGAEVSGLVHGGG